MAYDSKVTAVTIAPDHEGKIAIVRNRERDEPLWKYPGGKDEEGETPEQCALRELLDETGITGTVENLTLVSKLDRGTHLFFIYVLRHGDFSGLKSAGIEHGKPALEIRLARPWEILEMTDFVFHQKDASRDTLAQLLYGVFG